MDSESFSSGQFRCEWTWGEIKERLEYLIKVSGGGNETIIKYIDITSEYGKEKGIIAFRDGNEISFHMGDIHDIIS